MYTINSQATTSSCGADGKLKLVSALQMMQDCSELWIDSEPTFKCFLQEQGVAQLLASRQVEVIRRPSFREKLTITTSVYDVKPMFGFRNTFIYDEAGNVCYRSYSVGVFVHKKSGRLTRLSDEVIQACAIDERLPMNYLDRRIMVPQAETIQFPLVEVQRNDIDYNLHMNNANYVRIALELLPELFQPQTMRVEFRVPAKLGDELQPEMVQTNNAIYVVLRLEEKVSAVMEFSPFV